MFVSIGMYILEWQAVFDDCQFSLNVLWAARFDLSWDLSQVYVAAMLMMFGASLTAQDFWGRTALSYAERQKDEAMMKAGTMNLFEDLAKTFWFTFWSCLGDVLGLA